MDLSGLAFLSKGDLLEMGLLEISDWFKRDMLWYVGSGKKSTLFVEISVFPGAVIQPDLDGSPSCASFSRQSRWL